MYADIVCRVLVGAYCGGYLPVAWACTPGAGALPWRAWVLPVGAFRFRHSLWALTHSPRGYSRRGRSCGAHAPRRALSGAGALPWVLCAPDVLSALTPAHSRRSLLSPPHTPGALCGAHTPPRALSPARACTPGAHSHCGGLSRRGCLLLPVGAHTLPARALTLPRRSPLPVAGYLSWCCAPSALSGVTPLVGAYSPPPALSVALTLPRRFVLPARTLPVRAL